MTKTSLETNSLSSASEHEEANPEATAASAATSGSATPPTGSGGGRRPRSGSIICTEVFDEHSQPSQKEILEYAAKIGIDPDAESHLLNLAKEGILRELPAEWKPCWDETIGDYYYFNVENGQTQWGHPLDEIYRQKVILAREEDKPKSKGVPPADDVTEVSADISSDLASSIAASTNAKTNDVNKNPASEEEEEESDVMANEPKPLKLGPLPPLGGGNKLAPLGKKSLPPLKKPGLNPLGTGASPASSPRLGRSGRTLGENLSNNNSPMMSPLASPSKSRIGLSAAASTASATSPSKQEAAKPNSKGLSLKLGGSNFMKPQIRETLLSDGADDSASVDEIKIVTNDNNSGDVKKVTKSILKTSPKRKNPADQSDHKSGLRAAMIAKDEKRIQFNIEDDKLKLEITNDSGTSSSDKSDDQDDEVRDREAKKRDLMEQLFDPADLTITPTSTVEDEASTYSKGNMFPFPIKDNAKDVLSKPQMNPVKKPSPRMPLARLNANPDSESIDPGDKPNQMPPGSVPKAARPQSARTLSSTLKKGQMTVKSSSASSSSNDDSDDVLRNVKFKSDHLANARSKRSDSSVSKSKIDLAGIGEPISKEALNKQESKIRDEVRKQFDLEMEAVKSNFDNEKASQEQMLRDMHKAELSAMQDRLEKEFERQKTILTDNFSDQLSEERRNMQLKHEEQMKQREAELRREIQNLRADLENKKANLEVELKAQFAKEVAQLRDELNRVQRDRELEIANSTVQASKQESPPFRQQPQPPRSNVKTRPLNARSTNSNRNSAFMRELESIESDIRQLKSQVKVDDFHDYNSEDTNTTLSDEEVMPMPRQSLPRGGRMAFDSDFYESPMDLTRTLTELQHRVNSLERSLIPFTVSPYQAVPAYNNFMPASSYQSGFTSNPPVSATPSVSNGDIKIPVARQTTVVTNGWTVEEQIFKSKMWLKQRNQQMLPRT